MINQHDEELIKVVLADFEKAWTHLQINKVALTTACKNANLTNNRGLTVWECLHQFHTQLLRMSTEWNQLNNVIHNICPPTN